MKTKNLREHGLPQTGVPAGTPEWKPIDKDVPCPNCGGQLVSVKIPMRDVAMLRGGKGDGMYLGCPCCPYASPMMVVATQQPEDETASKRDT